MLEPLLSEDPTRHVGHPKEACPTTGAKVGLLHGDRCDELVAQAAAQWGSALIAAASSSQRYAMFDCTRPRTQQLFKVLVGDGDGGMDLDMFRKGLEAHSFQIEASSPEGKRLLRAVFKVAANEKDMMDVTEFRAALQRLKLHVLFQQMQSRTHRKQVEGCCLDWSPVDLYSKLVKSEDLYDHLLTPRAQQFTMRWAHYTEPDEYTLLSLGVSHQLHLRALGFYNSEQGETNMWVRGDDYNMLVPLFRLTEASRALLQKHEAESRSASAPQRRVVVELEWAQLYIFMSGQQDSIVTTRSAWRVPRVTQHLSGEHTQRAVHRQRHRHRRRRHVEDGRALAEHHLGKGLPLKVHNVSPKVEQHLDMFSHAFHELEQDYSELRIGGAPLLVFRLLGATLKSHVEVHTAYRARLEWFEDHIDEHAKLELAQMKRELGHHVRRLEALTQLVTRISTCTCFEAKVNVDGLRDKIIQLSRDIGEAMESCEMLLDEVKAQIEFKQSRSAFSITLIVTLLYPLQFLTGVYGMNFQNEAGQGGVPLLGMLTLDNSYFMFWGLGLLLTLPLMAWFRHAGLLHWH